ncbi:MAG: hypothetical protein ACI9EF_002093 [Pseudohongiellaceae bacterium]
MRDEGSDLDASKVTDNDLASEADDAQGEGLAHGSADAQLDPHVDPLVIRLEDELRLRAEGMAGKDLGSFVSSELLEVHRALRSVLDQDLHRGTLFCEWGSGFGAICALAASLGLEAHGIEIQGELVVAAEELMQELDLEASFVQGTFLLPGVEDLAATCKHTEGEASDQAYRELGLPLSAFDIVFAYPWPQEEMLHEELFLLHGSAGALLLTYAEFAGVLVQRHTGDRKEIQTLGWMGRA